MLFRKLRHDLWVLRERKKTKAIIQRARASGNLKLNIGSGTVHFPGWINLDLPFFDLRNDKLWSYFLNKLHFDHILLEHVLEHLTHDEVKTSLLLAKKYMTADSVIRIAVPDKNHPSQAYIDYVKPGGTGPGSDDHKSFWNLNDFEQLGEQLNFQINPLEYYDREGQLHMNELNDALGHISRTARIVRAHHPIKNYSSLIVDVRLKS